MHRFYDWITNLGMAYDCVQSETWKAINMNNCVIAILYKIREENTIVRVYQFITNLIFENKIKFSKHPANILKKRLQMFGCYLDLLFFLFIFLNIKDKGSSL